MFGKLKQVIKDINTMFLLLQVYGDDIKQLKAEVALLKPKKKVVAKSEIKAPVKKK
jgi:hypothetical protein